jgi:hypothetical protein
MANYRKKQLPKYLLPQDRRYFVSTHFDDYSNGSRFTYSQHASNYNEAVRLAKEHEEYDRRFINHPLQHVHSTIVRTQAKHKYKIK